MLSAWLILRQADEALNGGRLDEAVELIKQREVQGHKRAGDLRQELGRRFVDRARLHLQHHDVAAAWRDLIQAEATGLQNKTAVELRQQLVQRSLSELKGLLETGEAVRATEMAQQLRERGVELPELRLLEDIARSWSLGQELAVRGEFSQALIAMDRARRLAPGKFRLLDEHHHELERRRREFEPVLIKLHEAMEQGNWRETMQLADQVLALAPQHAEARRARAKAWKAVEPPTVHLAGTKPTGKRPGEEEPPRRLLLWIDGVGGYLVCLSSRVSFGQATPESYVDIPLYADVSRLHGYLTRDEEGYLLEAVRPVTLNQKPVDRALLRDGDRLTIGSSCQFKFRQPVPLSSTARLELVSNHRLPLSVDGVLLMAETCVLGRTGEAHIVIPELKQPVVLFRRKEGLGVRVPGDFKVDGQPFRDKAALGPYSTVAAGDLRFTVEAIGARIGTARV